MRSRTRRLLALGAAGLLAGSLIQALGGSPAAADAPAKYQVVRAQVFTAEGLGTVAVGMPTKRKVMIQHLRSDGSWSPPRLIFNSGQQRTCGDIEGAASPGGIALSIECDASYHEENAPTKTQALVSRDLQTWVGHKVPGESYRRPGISPSGEYAVWAANGGSDVFTWGASEAFGLPLRPVGHDFDSGDLAFVVDNAGAFTVAGPDSANGRCVVGLYGRTLDGATTRQQVDIAPGAETGCTELSAYADSSTRITSGPYVDRPGRWVIGRSDESSPWTLLERAPNQAPGFEEYRGSSRRTMYAVFSDVTGQSLLALGSPDRRHVTVQAYDDQAQRWGPTRVIYDHGFPGCTWDSSAEGHYAVHNLLMHCYPTRRPSGDYPPHNDDYDPAPVNATTALLSIDGSTWRAFRMGSRPVTSAPDRSLVAAGRAKNTTIASRDGFTTVAAGAPGRCEAVVPIGPRRLLRLHATGGSKGFPTELQRLTPSGWKRVHRIDGRFHGRCQGVEMARFGLSGTFYFRATGETRPLRIVRTEHGWRAVSVRGY
jgi:hypothetical protein